MELGGTDFYVANTDSVWRFTYHEGQTAISEQGQKITDLPAGPINYHWTRNILADTDGKMLYITVGSNSNIAEKGIDKEKARAAIWRLNLETGHKRIFASGPEKSKWPGLGAGNGCLVDDRQ